MSEFDEWLHENLELLSLKNSLINGGWKAVAKMAWDAAKKRPDSERLYYLRDCRDTVGNSVLWWAHNDKGYTCDIRLARVFTESEVETYSDRDTDRAYLVSDVLPLAQHHIDIQDLNANPKRKRPWTMDSLGRRASLEER